MSQIERVHHINVVNWFKHFYPDLEDDFHHFANERRLEKRGGAEFYEGKMLKRMGVKRGVADFFIALPRNGKSGLWVELKVGTNKLSAEQKAFLDRKESRGYAVGVAHGFDQACEIIKEYLNE